MAHFTVGGLFTLLITGVTLFMTSVAFELVTITRSLANYIIFLETCMLYPAHRGQYAMQGRQPRNHSGHRWSVHGDTLARLLFTRVIITRTTNVGRGGSCGASLAFYISIIMASVGSHRGEDSLSSAK